MGLIFDFALFGLFFYIMVAMLYFLGLALMLAVYSLIKHGNFSSFLSHWVQAAKAAFIGSALNNLTAIALAAIILNELLSGGLQMMQSVGANPAPVPAGIAYLSILSVGKITLFATLSLMIWFLVAVALTYWLAKGRSAKREAPKPELKAKRRGRK
ncbi:MAG: hypothetical protein V1835_06390 [Candidatus Micrarchaeota archaeon]